MKSDTFLALQIAKWGLIWAFGLSFLAPLLTWALAPQMFGDGQYGMIFLVTFPLGWVVGAIVAVRQCARMLDVPSGGKASFLGAAVTGLGCIVLPFGGMIFMMFAFALVGALVRNLGG